jgi:hypothetical protein
VNIQRQKQADVGVVQDYELKTRMVALQQNPDPAVCSALVPRDLRPSQLSPSNISEVNELKYKGYTTEGYFGTGGSQWFAHPIGHSLGTAYKNRGNR